MVRIKDMESDNMYVYIYLSLSLFLYLIQLYKYLDHVKPRRSRGFDGPVILLLPGTATAQILKDKEVYVNLRSLFSLRSYNIPSFFFFALESYYSISEVENGQPASLFHT